MTDISEILSDTKDTTTIDPNISFVGTMTVTGPGAVQIGGEFEGRIEAQDGSVVVQAGGSVRGTIIAANIIVSGTVTALTEDDFVEASKNLALTETADLQSNVVRYGNMAMTFGASIRGNMMPLANATRAALPGLAVLSATTTPAATGNPRAEATAIASAGSASVVRNIHEKNRPSVAPPAPPETLSKEIERMTSAELMTPLRTGTHDSDSALVPLDA